MSDIQKAAKSVETFLKHFKDLGDVLKETADFERLHAERNAAAGDAHKALLETNKKVSDAQDQLDALVVDIQSADDSLADVKQEADGIIRAAQDTSEAERAKRIDENFLAIEEFDENFTDYMADAELKKLDQKAQLEAVTQAVISKQDALAKIEAELDALKSKFA